MFMKILFAALGVMAIIVAVTVAPDLKRYLHMRGM